MKTRHIICAMLLMAAFAGCGNDEDTAPSFADINIFEPAEDDRSETAQIRREFFNATGSYILFTDTLRAVNRGTAADGSVISRPELLDVMAYAMIGYGDRTTYRYDYITEPSKQREAVRLINDHLVWRLGKALPYAFFLVDGISYTDSKDKVVYAEKLIGLRAYAISLNHGEAATDPETYFGNMIADMVRAKIQSMGDDELAPFYAFSYEYYLQDKDKFGLSTTTTPDSEMWNFGFFTDVYRDYFPDKSYDLKAWTTKVITLSREEFEAQYGSNQIMMDKFDALAKIISDLGYVLR